MAGGDRGQEEPGCPGLPAGGQQREEGLYVFPLFFLPQVPDGYNPVVCWSQGALVLHKAGHNRS